MPQRPHLRLRQTLALQPPLTALLAPKLHLLQAQGLAMYFCHRAEIGDPATFLAAVQHWLREVLPTTTLVAGWRVPWTPAMATNLLLVTVPEWRRSDG